MIHVSPTMILFAELPASFSEIESEFTETGSGGEIEDNNRLTLDMNTK